MPLPAGQITAIVGANASGKSTLLRAFARLLKPTAGAVLLDGAEISSLPTREVARAARLPAAVAGPARGADGRGPRRARPLPAPAARPPRSPPRTASASSGRSTATGIADLRDRPLDRLSGGQRQRAWIAMALAQDTPILLLDEPTTYLDLAHQLEVLDLLADLNEQGRTIGLVLHDLNHACRYAHHLVALRDGRRPRRRPAGGDRRRGARPGRLRAALARAARPGHRDADVRRRSAATRLRSVRPDVEVRAYGR